MEKGTSYASVRYFAELLNLTLDYYEETNSYGNLQTNILLQSDLNFYEEQGTLRYIVEKGYTPTNRTENGKTIDEPAVIKDYYGAFEGLPQFLKKNILQVEFWSGATWLKNDIYGDGKHHMAVTAWHNTFGTKCPICIDLGKPATTGEFAYKAVAAHEAGHALDTWEQKYSDTKAWKDIIKGIESRIYSASTEPHEVFAAAVSRHHRGNLRTISEKAYNYINEIATGQR